MFDLQDYLKNLERVVNIDSNSFYIEGINKNADIYAEIAEKFGLFVNRIHLDDATGDYLEITNKKNPTHFDVVMMGHMDTVQPVGKAKEMPFSIEGDVCVGPGVADMKSGTLASLYIYNELPNEVKEKLSVAILMNPDEEISSKYSKYHTMEIAKKTDYAFVMENPSHKFTHTRARKGSGNFKIKFHGIPCHAGYLFERKSANAILEMSYWAQELHKLNDEKSKFSLNIATCSGGTAVNVCPEFCEMTLNVRVAEKNQYKILEDKIEYLKAHPMIEGVSAEVETISQNFPMIPVDGMSEWCDRVVKVAKGLGYDFKFYELRGGSSDGNYIADMGTKCLDSMGPQANGGHTAKEIMFLDDVVPTIETMVGIIKEIADNI